MATVGFDFYSFFARIEGKLIRLQIWDTCGQEGYRSLVQNFFRGTALGILVYAINDKELEDKMNKLEIKIESQL